MVSEDISVVPHLNARNAMQQMLKTSNKLLKINNVLDLRSKDLPK